MGRSPGRGQGHASLSGRRLLMCQLAEVVAADRSDPKVGWVSLVQLLEPDCRAVTCCGESVDNAVVLVLDLTLDNPSLAKLAEPLLQEIEAIRDQVERPTTAFSYSPSSLRSSSTGSSCHSAR